MKSEAIYRHSPPEKMFRLPDERTFHDFPVRHRNPSWLTGVAFHNKKGQQLNVSNAAGILNPSAFFYEFTDIKSLWRSDWTIFDEEGQSVPYESSPLQKALRTGKAYKDVLYIHMDKGEQRCVFFVSQPFRTSYTTESFIMTSIIDVTMEKDRLLKTDLPSQLPVLSWIVNEQGYLQFANDSFYNYFGLQKSVSLGKKLSDLVSGAVSNKLYNRYLTVLNTGKSMQTTERIKLVDGNSFTARTIIFPVKAPGNEILIAGHSIHMPDQQRSRKRKDNLALLNYATSDAIWEWDMQSGQVYRNEPLMKMIGYNAKFLKGVGWWLRNIHSDDRLRVVRKVKETINKRRSSWQEEYRFRSADGSYKHIKDRGFVVYEKGEAIKMIGSLTDITRVKELEQELKNEKLRREMEVAETVIRVQEQERAHIGHELHDNVNQILCSAKLYTQMIRLADTGQQDIKGKAMDYITLAVEEIRKLSRELTAPQLKHGLTDSIRALINDMNESSSSVKFGFLHEGDCESASGEKKVTLFRIVQEQIKNILKHSRATVAGISLCRSGADFRLVIWDDGIGFNPHQVVQGIGLSNIQDRLSFFNGKCAIESAPGQGCKLIVQLPA